MDFIEVSLLKFMLKIFKIIKVSYVVPLVNIKKIVTNRTVLLCPHSPGYWDCMGEWYLHDAEINDFCIEKIDHRHEIEHFDKKSCLVKIV